MIKKLIVLIALSCAACQSQMIEEKLPSNNAEYLIQHPKDWDFRNYGFDGDTYTDPYLEASATLTYGKLLDAKISIYFIEKLGTHCVLKETTAHTYQEAEVSLTQESRKKALGEFLDEWKKDGQTEFVRVYFAASDKKECILFDLYRKKGSKQKQILKSFHDIISSFHEVAKK